MTIPHFRRLRKSLSATSYDVFLDGKVKYFLRKCEILLTQCDICLRHVDVSLRYDLNFKGRYPRISSFSSIFSQKIYHRRSLYHTPSAYITDLLCKSISGSWSYSYDQLPFTQGGLFFILYCLQEWLPTGQDPSCNHLMSDKNKRG